MVRTIAALCLCILPFSTPAAALVDEFAPGAPYYYESFEPEQRPWKPGQNRNIEEVFKNYQYYEIKLDDDLKGITVNRFVRGSKAATEKYLILPDGSLQRR